MVSVKKYIKSGYFTHPKNTYIPKKELSFFPCRSRDKYMNIMTNVTLGPTCPDLPTARAAVGFTGSNPPKNTRDDASSRFLGLSLINRRHARSFSRASSSCGRASLNQEDTTSRLRLGSAVHDGIRYGTVRSPMTEWHGSSLASFPLFSHLRVVHVRRISCLVCMRVCVCSRACVCVCVVCIVHVRDPDCT